MPADKIFFYRRGKWPKFEGLHQQKFLKNSLFIKKLVSAAMICVFAFSIVPTIFLHKTFASHIDSVEKSVGHGEHRISNDLFNCQCDHLVAESPFTEAAVFRLVPSPHTFLVPEQRLQVHLVPCHAIFHSLRGPPLV